MDLDALVKDTRIQDRVRLGRQSAAEIVRNLVTGYLAAVKSQPELGSQNAVSGVPERKRIVKKQAGRAG